MSSINQIISELAHNVKQPDSVPVRNALKLSIIHARNKLIRQSQQNHGYVDKALNQRIKLSLIDVPDGDIPELSGIADNIKRTKCFVPKPTRFANNTPFQAVHTVGYKNSVEIPFIKETVAKFYNYLPGLCKHGGYDYINGYIYIFTDNDTPLASISNIIVESVFEQPQMINVETYEGTDDRHGQEDDNEFLIPEDMIDDLKKLVLDTFMPANIRQTNEIPTITKIS